MSEGTIHPIDQDLLLVEGDPSSGLPGSAVFGSGGRVYLLDTGSGPRQRSSIYAVLASFRQVDELILINSGCHPVLTGNNDLLDTSAARTRMHLRPRGACPLDHSTEPVERAWSSAIHPSPRPTVVPPESLDAVAEAMSWVAGGMTRVAWQFGEELLTMEMTTRTRRLAFFLPAQRALLLPEELALAPLGPRGDMTDVLRASALVSGLHADGLVDVVSLGFGVPVSVEQAHAALEQAR